MRGAAAGTLLLLTGCAEPLDKPSSTGAPLTPEAVFLGLAPATGTLKVIGRPARAFTVENRGRREGGTLVLDQVIRFADDGDEDRRTWRTRATGLEGAGGALRLRYTFDQAGPGGLQMEHWLARRSDGTISNQAVGRKWGVAVGRIDETIRPDLAAR